METLTDGEHVARHLRLLACIIYRAVVMGCWTHAAKTYAAAAPHGMQRLGDMPPARVCVYV